MSWTHSGVIVERTNDLVRVYTANYYEHNLFYNKLDQLHEYAKREIDPLLTEGEGLYVMSIGYGSAFATPSPIFYKAVKIAEPGFWELPIPTSEDGQ